MKLKIVCASIAGSLFIAPSLFAQIVGTGSLEINAPNYSSVGDQAGPYMVSGLTASSGVTPASSFQTFCIGSQVDYYPGSTYNYQISGTVQPTSGVGSPGYVTWGTAYLYNQFLAGVLGIGGNGSMVAADNAENDGLQLAIWELQQQSLSGIKFGQNSTDVNNWANEFLADALTAAANAGVSDGSNANGAFGIYALNMYSGSSSDPDYAQPELVKVPVPEASTVYAGALLLVPLGLGILRRARRPAQAA